MRARQHSSAFSLLSDFDRTNAGEATLDRDAAIKTAFKDGHRQGHAEGRAEAESDAELRLAEAEIRQTEAIAAEKEVWHRDCADVLIARFEGATKLIESAIEERVAGLLKPWLITRLHGRALKELELAIARALAEGAKTHIEAPAEIIAHLRRRLPSEGFEIGYSESTDANVRAHIEDTVIEANIAAWIASLEVSDQ